MDSDQLSQILTQALNNINQKRRQEHLNAINDYVRFIKDGNNPQQNNYIFDILREIGYLGMMEFDWKQDQKLAMAMTDILNLGLLQDESVTPTSIDFDELTFDTEQYIGMWNTFIHNQLPPRLNELRKDREWDDRWWKLEEDAADLVLRGLDITAIEYGYQLTDHPKNLRAAWQRFSQNAEFYIQNLYENRECFYPFSDTILKLCSDFLPFLPSSRFREFVLDVTRKSSVLYNHFRRIISHEDADQIYYDTKLRFENYPSAAWIYFYELALAETAVSNFIFSTCHEIANYFSIQWHVITSSDGDTPYEVPIVRAGQKEYSVHIENNVRVGGWGIRKDRLMKVFHDPQYNGALFCSMKEYPTGKILIRFENYVDKKRLGDLLKKPEEFKDYIKLTFDDVYEPESRESFLKMAAEHAISAVIPSVETETAVERFLKELQILQYLVGASFIVWQSIYRAKMLKNFLALHKSTGRGQGTETCKEEPKKITFIPMTFTDEQQEISFLDLEKHKAVLDPIKKCIDDQVVWQFIAFYQLRDKTDIQPSDTYQYRKNRNVTLPIPAGTEAVLIAFGPPDEIEALKNPLAEDTASHRIYWIIYGPEKEKDEHHE